MFRTTSRIIMTYLRMFRHTFSGRDLPLTRISGDFCPRYVRDCSRSRPFFVYSGASVLCIGRSGLGARNEGWNSQLVPIQAQEIGAVHRRRMKSGRIGNGTCQMSIMRHSVHSQYNTCDAEYKWLPVALTLSPNSCSLAMLGKILFTAFALIGLGEYLLRTFEPWPVIDISHT